MQQSQKAIEQRLRTVIGRQNGFGPSRLQAKVVAFPIEFDEIVPEEVDVLKRHLDANFVFEKGEKKPIVGLREEFSAGVAVAQKLHDVLVIRRQQV